MKWYWKLLFLLILLTMAGVFIYEKYCDLGSISTLNSTVRKLSRTNLELERDLANARRELGIADGYSKTLERENNALGRELEKARALSPRSIEITADLRGDNTRAEAILAESLLLVRKLREQIEGD